MAKRALIIANGSFADKEIGALVSPLADAERLRRLLMRPEVGGYDVTVVANSDSATARLNAQLFFNGAKFEDTNFILVSTHGIKDRKGNLHFATADTQMKALAATALDSRFLMERMEDSAAARQVLFLDTCYSGAFNRGMIGKNIRPTISLDDFGGSDAGSAIITASTAIQIAGEAESDGVIQSLFTRCLIEGIETGGADFDSSGKLSLRNLFHYVQDALRREAPQQQPQPHFRGTDGKMVIAFNPVPLELPSHLVKQVSSKDVTRRLKAIDELFRLARSGNGSHTLALERLRALTEDDSLSVSTVAREAINKLITKSPLASVAVSNVPFKDSGAIFLAKIISVNSMTQDAMIDAGTYTGKLHISDIHPDYFQIPVAMRNSLFQEYSASRLFHNIWTEEFFDADIPKLSSDPTQHTIQKVVAPRQVLLVQLCDGAEQGPHRFTTILAIGREFLTLAPNGGFGIRISKRIVATSERARLKRVITSLQLPPTMGLLVQEAAVNMSTAQIRNCFDVLAQQWDEIREETLASSAPALICRPVVEPPLTTARTTRNNKN